MTHRVIPESGIANHVVFAFSASLREESLNVQPQKSAVLSLDALCASESHVVARALRRMAVTIFDAQVHWSAASASARYDTTGGDAQVVAVDRGRRRRRTVGSIRSPFVGNVLPDISGHIGGLLRTPLRRLRVRSAAETAEGKQKRQKKRWKRIGTRHVVGNGKCVFDLYEAGSKNVNDRWISPTYRTSTTRRPVAVRSH